MENLAARPARSAIQNRWIALVAISCVAGACSFAWEDYRPAADAGASTGVGASSSESSAASSTSGSGGESGAAGSGGDGGGDCGADQKLCGGACVEIDDPTFGCTTTGCQPCALPNAMTSCEAGVCVPGACSRGFGDCDPVAAGCETPTSTSSQHCGDCNQPCPGTSCINGACSLENCSNGNDDDDDGLVDCADADCVTYSCAVVQNPWKGPVFLYDGAFATQPADCAALPGTLEYQGFNGVSANPAVCSGCTCGVPGVDCTLGLLHVFASFGCPDEIGSGPLAPADTCIAAGGPIASVLADAPTASGSCTAAGGTATLDPLTWQSAGVACKPGTVGGGCGGNGVCVGNAPASFGAKPCTYRGGNQACPSGFPEKHLFHDGADDTRACTTCECGPAQGSGACGATTDVFPLDACNGSAVGVPNDGGCVDVPAAASIYTAVGVAANDFLDCPPSGGAPSGAVVESASVTTVCCAQ